MDKLNEFFQSKNLGNGLYQIRCAAQEIVYLIEGTDHAYLIDSGTGFGSLRTYVESITDRPITVLLTHGHMDHAMGAAEFDDVYMNPADDRQYREHCREPYRTEYCKIFFGDKFKYVFPYMIPSQKLKYKPLLPGMEFKTGNHTIKVLDGAGHTKGSVCMLLVEDRILILGDACTGNTLLLDGDSLNIKEYRKTMLRLLKDTTGKYDKVWFSHGQGVDTRGYLESMISVCDIVLSGKSANIPYEFMGYSLLAAMPRDEKMRRLDGGLANLCYSADLLY